VSCYAFFKGWLLLSPPPGCLGLQTTFHVTLSRNLGTLTLGWVAFPYGPQAYPRGPHSQRLQRSQVRSLTRGRPVSRPKSLISRSTPRPISAEIYLRVVSGGTSYSQFRLAFHPYAQIIRKICTSLPVRSSTLLSKGFNLFRHRSTGFGYPSNDSRRAHLAPRALRRCGLFGFPSTPLLQA
jgi:hypothetical protein